MSHALRTVAIVEARMTSSRLPGKVLFPVAGRPLLGLLVDRLHKVPSLDAIYVATTINEADDQIEIFCRDERIGCYRGSERDVMARVLETAMAAEADVIVEVTGDCPLIDPDIVEQVIRIHLANEGDYTSNNHFRSYPDGMDVQVFSRAALARSASSTTDALDREHVTLHMRNNPQDFSQVHVLAPPSLHWPELGLTLDEMDDYILLTDVIEHLGKSQDVFSCSDIIEYLRAHPEKVELNSHVLRKGDL